MDRRATNESYTPGWLIQLPGQEGWCVKRHLQLFRREGRREMAVRKAARGGGWAQGALKTEAAGLGSWPDEQAKGKSEAQRGCQGRKLGPSGTRWDNKQKQRPPDEEKTRLLQGPVKPSGEHAKAMGNAGLKTRMWINTSQPGHRATGKIRGDGKAEGTLGLTSKSPCTYKAWQLVFLLPLHNTF